MGIIKHEKGKQSKEHVHLYTWGEYAAGKGANEIASALYNYLSTSLPRGTTLVKLFAMLVLDKTETLCY